ncbi:MAG: ATP-grasp domain-containing protein [Gammaproteobacteria bacterium]
MKWPGRSPLAESAYLIIGQSGRALAQSAHQSRAAVHVVDLFADRDTHDWARSVTRVPPGSWGFDREALCAAIERVGAGDRIAGVVAGSGFEQDPTLLDVLPAGTELLGNAAEIVRSVKDPVSFFGALSRLGIPYPETRSSPAGDSRGWLRKRIGGSGGMHVLPLGADGQCPPGHFLQRAVAGRAHSVIFAANGRRAAIVGYNAIWQEPGRFTYRGAIADRSLPARVRTDLAEGILELTAAFGLRGLCGADFIVDDDERWVLLEINPRPTASFELHERDGGLFTVHVDACRGRLPVRISAQEKKIAAVRVLYAPHALRIPRPWRGWSRDWPAPGTRVRAGEPICTVHAAGYEPGPVTRLLDTRCQRLLAVLTAG